MYLLEIFVSLEIEILPMGKSPKKNYKVWGEWSGWTPVCLILIRELSGWILDTFLLEINYIEKVISVVIFFEI